jgi:hypothetical protein
MEIPILFIMGIYLKQNTVFDHYCQDLFIFEDLSVLERLSILSRLGVTNVICAGISQSFHDKLTAAKISPVTGIVGEVDEALSAFMCEGLNDPRFDMPGYKPAS